MNIDLTIEQYEGNATHPAHGRTPLMFRGPVWHGLTAARNIPNVYDGSPVSVTNEYLLITGHTGTHVDAPHHVDRQSPITAERLPLDRTSGPAIWLDLAEHCAEDPRISIDDLLDAEQRAGSAIEAGDIVLLHTGWNDERSTDGPEPPGTNPHLVQESAEWLRGRGIKALGIDAPSPEEAQAVHLPVHMNFLRPRSLGLPDEDYILIYENLCNIAAIPPARFTFYGLPIPFRGSSGSPVRAVAVVA